MKLLKSLVAAGSVLFSLNAVAASNYQDWWGDASKDGMGLNVGHQGNVLAVSWYHFGTDGKASYVLLAGTLDESGMLVGDLQSATGSAPGPAYNPGSVQRNVIGMGKLHFLSDTSATFEYTINGVSGSMNLTRFSMASPALDGTYYVATEYRWSDCTNASDNMPFPDVMENDVRITGKGNGVYAVKIDTCEGTINLTQSGSILSGQGALTCLSGTLKGTTMVFERVRRIENNLNVDYSIKYDPPFGCTEKGTMGGVRSDYLQNLYPLYPF